MLPNNALSTVPLPAPWLYTIRRWSSPFVDWEQGGVALEDASQGMTTQLWQLQYDHVTGNFNVIDAAGNSTLVFTQLNASSVGLAFDQTMHPALCWVDTSGSYIRWFNSTTGQYVVTTVTGATNACITLDEHRLQFLSVSDVIFAYNNSSGALCYRQQRDNYATEYTLSASPGGTLIAVGMNTGLRLQFRLKPNT